MDKILNAIFNWTQLQTLLNQLQPGTKIDWSVNAAWSYFALQLARSGYNILVLTDEEKCGLLAEDCQALQEILNDSFSIQNWADSDIHTTAAALQESLESSGLIWFCDEGSIDKKVIAQKDFSEQRLKLKVGNNVKHSDVLDYLSRHGYRRVDMVELPGSFALRGEIIDFWSPNYDRALRLVYSFDVVESIHFFNIDTQRTSDFCPQVQIIPIEDSVFNPQECNSSIFEYLPQKTVVMIDPLFNLENFPLDVLQNFAQVSLSGGINLGLEKPVTLQSNWNFLKEQLIRNYKNKMQTYIFCRNGGQAERLEDILDQLHCSKSERAQILVCPITQGWIHRDLNYCVFSFNDLTGTRALAKRRRRYVAANAIDAITQINTGDYVVHEKYGIGRYRGLERIQFQLKVRPGSNARIDKTSEFLVIEYKNSDRLLVPVQEFKLIQKYVGQEGKRPQIYPLDGGAAWDKTTQKVKEDVAALAEEILKTAAQRANTTRGAELIEQQDIAGEQMFKEFLEAFPYEETQDQRNATQEILRDMQSPKLMDRLVCGDVGYGKTEVAMRAAFKAICEQKQVAVLVPTAILAEQHYKNFKERFAAFPVNIALLSRFQDVQEQSTILRDCAEGTVNLVIGTHRLLNPDAKFKNLGLIIIDEEHRFGVKQKEELKKKRVGSDVLSLSATPIPRTLSQALGGVRDISLIETPPQGRLPIETHVGVFQEDVVRQAVEKELKRGGQIFYVHNRIASIENRKEMLERVIPNIRIGIVHGRMNSQQLEDAMHKFLHRDWDILLATSIIESGLDIPTVNTLIVEDSEDFGLAQLYQLRGRVGRQRIKAYCYLFFSGWSNLSDDARKRLQAIQEFSALGSGMKLALRDMEIRGTGNLLGSAQHGWVNVVGLEMYSQLLSSAVRRLHLTKKSDQVPQENKFFAPAALNLPEVDLALSAYIPGEYIDSSAERIVLYKKITSAQNYADLARLEKEFSDRFGHLAVEVQNLFAIMRLRLDAQNYGFNAFVQTEKGFVIDWKAVNGQTAIDYVKLAQNFTSPLQILPPDPDKPNTLSILFSEDSIDYPLERARSLLNRLKPFAIIEEL